MATEYPRKASKFISPLLHYLLLSLSYSLYLHGTLSPYSQHLLYSLRTHAFVFVGGIFQHISFIDVKTGESVIGNFQLFPSVNASGKTVSTIQFSEPVPSGTNVVVMYTEVAA